MLSKETFIKIITDMQKEDKKINDLSNFLEENIIDGYATVKESISRNCIWDILKDIYTEDGEDLISWWMYEDVEKYLYNKTGQIIEDLTTIEALYEYLTKTYKK